MNLKRLLISAVLAVLTVGILGQPVIAHEGHDHAETRTAIQERIKGRLDEARKKVCENRKAAITRITTNAASQGQRHLNLFGSIATKVQGFYTDKKLVAADYDTAVQKVSANKTALQNAITEVKNSATTLDCSGSDPVGTVDAIKAKITAMHKAARELQASVKNLIVIVKAAAGGTR